MLKKYFVMDVTFFHKIKKIDVVLAILTLWTVAVSKPLLDVLGASPEYWVANFIDIWVIILIVLVLCVAMPLVLGLCIIALKSKKKFWIVSAMVFGVCFFVLFTIATYHGVSLMLGKRMALLVGSLPVAVFALWLYACFQGFRLFFSIMSILAILVPASFLFMGPTKSLLLAPADAATNIKPVVTLEGPLVFIVFDEMNLASMLNEKGLIDSRLFPNFSRLAATSTWFKNGSTNYGTTERAVPCLLSGRFQNEAAASVSYRQNPRNLFTLFQAPDGVFAMESATNLCPPSICGVQHRRIFSIFKQTIADFILIYKNIMVPSRFAAIIEPIPHRFDNLAGVDDGSNVADDGSGIVKKITRWFTEGRNKSIVYMHFGLPHAPYARNTDGSQYTLSADYNMLGWDQKQHKWLSPAKFHTAQGFQRYLLQAMYADKVLGDIMDSLTKDGLFDESTLVVTADHGVGFFAGCLRRTEKVIECALGENNAVPFFLKVRNQSAGVSSSRNMEFIDVVPTLLAQMGAGAEKIGQLELDGWSPDMKKERQVKVFGGQEYSKDLFQKALDARNRLFDGVHITEGKDGGWFPHIKKYRELIGMQTIGSVTGSAVLEIENLSIIANLGRVDKKSNFIPNYVAGKLRSGAVDTIGVGVNGVIADVVDVYVDSDGQRRFSSVFDSGFLKTGVNDLKLFSVKRDSSNRISLQMVNTDAVLFELKKDTVVDASERPLRKEQKRLVGAIDDFDSRIPGLIYMKGWMGDRIKWKPPLAYLVSYRGEQFISRTTISRPDLAKLNQDMTRSGFYASLSLGGKLFEKEQLRIFVIFDNESYAEMAIKQGFQTGE